MSIENKCDPNLKVRSPIQYKTEQLQINDNDNLLDEMDKAIYLSKIEYEKSQIEEREKNEKQSLRQKELQHKFSRILSELVRIGYYDLDIKNLYQELKPIIDSYCINEISIDSDKRDYILNLLYTIRLRPNEIELIKGLFIHPHFSVQNSS
jgi:hypothetical protein